MRKRTILGLDAGSYALKAVQIEATPRGAAVLQKSLYLPWPTGPDSRDGTPASLKESLRACAVTRGKVVSAPDGRGLLTRRISLPQMPARDLLEALKWKVKKELGEDPEELVLDYLPLGGPDPNGSRLGEWMVFALSKTSLQEHVRMLEEAGLKPVGVEPQATGLLHLFETCPSLAGEGSSLVLDLGARRTQLILALGAIPQFIREIPFSGRQLTQGLRDALGLDENTAEQKKRETGLRGTRAGERDLDGVSETLEPFVQELCTEIRYSLGYLQEHLPSLPPLRSLFLFGGGAHLPGLDETLSREFGLPCVPLPEFSGLGLPLSEDYRSFGQTAPASSLATALGLALREARG